METTRKKGADFFVGASLYSYPEGINEGSCSRCLPVPMQ